MADCNGLIKLGPITDSFTWMKTNTSADRRKGVFNQDSLPCLLDQSLVCQHFDAANILPGRAGRAARRRLLVIFRTHKPPGSSLIDLGGHAGTGYE